MYSKKGISKVKALEEQWQKEYSEKHGEVELKATTGAGIPVKPVYTPADIEEIPYEEIGMPGIYPYTRGLRPLCYQLRPWLTEIGSGFDRAEDTRQRWEMFRREGGTGIAGFPTATHTLDCPTQEGYDPDYPESRGRVGVGGFSVSTWKDLEELHKGRPLDEVNATYITIQVSLPILAMHVALAERQGVPLERLRGNQACLIGRHWFWHTAAYPPTSDLRLLTEQIKYCSRYLPRWNHTQVDGYDQAEAGTNAVQELAFALSAVIALVEECIKAGLYPDDFVHRFNDHMHFGLDFFEDIAKLRAYRKMWAKIMKERFGCKKPRSLQHVVSVQTAGDSLTAREPLNNIVRVTIEALGAALAGVDALWTLSYDEALAIPTEQAAKIALRTQQIILHETNIRNVSDPLGGSYYLEWLTNKLEEEAWKLIEKIDETGGYVRCIENGWLQNERVREGNKRQHAIDRGEKIIVGMNKYVSEEMQKVAIFRNAPEAEAEIIARLKRYKAERDYTKTKVALTKLKEVARRVNEEWPRGGDLMPAVIDAIRAGATLGETTDILKEVFGFY